MVVFIIQFFAFTFTLRRKNLLSHSKVSAGQVGSPSKLEPKLGWKIVLLEQPKQPNHAEAGLRLGPGPGPRSEFEREPEPEFQTYLGVWSRT